MELGGRLVALLLFRWRDSSFRLKAPRGGCSQGPSFPGVGRPFQPNPHAPQPLAYAASWPLHVGGLVSGTLPGVSPHASRHHASSHGGGTSSGILPGNPPGRPPKIYCIEACFYACLLDFYSYAFAGLFLRYPYLKNAVLVPCCSFVGVDVLRYPKL